MTNGLLIIGGLSSASIAILHVAIIKGGPAWYRYFGAGESMAQRANTNPAYTSFVTGLIAFVFALFSLFAFSGAGIIFELPLLKPVLKFISVVYLIRGIVGIPAVLVFNHPYLNELKERMGFMIVSSLIAMGCGLCYWFGLCNLSQL